ncbi:Small G protein signaling modulator 1/2 Rab-binding domain [Arabidopsis thaliana x Arabidopsis arenosa]|uniref:TBC1 domain family member 15 n=1 Tax=Arabidopsis thaliana x Arabidopsis arenosa TaxID=1240361 RepID=A0A8T1XHJ2_9BRAS|nr:Small G protein signaling modulator 1/2 Rab-binding domain [Arabidopsis thaliana x Arabidopsis arenosa]
MSMEASELQDLSDDADYAASQQQGSASMMRSDSGKRSSPSEHEDAELIYLKDNVAIHPTQFASERISGRLKLTKQDSVLFLSWIPYKGQTSNAKLSEKDRSLYTITAVPFTEVRSIRRHTPTLGWQYVIVVLSSGLAFPPLYFYNGGVREFLAIVKQHVFLARSSEDPNVFIVNDFQSPLQRTLSSLELPSSLPVASGQSVYPLDGGSSNENQGRTSADIGNRVSSVIQSGLRKQKSHDPTRDLSIHLLEKFSLVTKFARDTTTQLFSENNGFGTVDKRWNNLPIHSYPEKLSNIAEEKHNEIRHSYSENDLLKDEEISNDIDVPADPLEFNKLSLVWGKPRQPPMGHKEFTALLDSEGRVVESKALRERVFYGGIEHQLRREVWPFLLGYYAYDSTYAEREYLRSVKRMEYATLKQQWQSISPEQAKRFTKYRERKGLIDKDVVRTDRAFEYYEGDDNLHVNSMRDILLTYSFYNFDLGYCQGMSDYLSPILFVMEDESESFWCFVALMERLGPNFNRDQNGMHTQLFALSKLVELLDTPLHNYFKQNDCLNYFFCFRWILIQFKREFEYEKTMQLWEVMWTHYLSEHFHLYVCVAVLKRCRSKIMGEQMDFDTLLKFINELSGHIDLDSTVRDAEALCICAGENGAASIPPGTPPSLPLDDGTLYPQEDDVL